MVREVVGGRLHSKRLLTKTNRMPKWGERIINARHVNVIEESIVDPKKKELCTYTRNVGLTKVGMCVCVFVCVFFLGGYVEKNY